MAKPRTRRLVRADQSSRYQQSNPSSGVAVLEAAYFPMASRFARYRDGENGHITSPVPYYCSLSISSEVVNFPETLKSEPSPSPEGS